MRYRLGILSCSALAANLLIAPANATSQEREVLRQTFHNFFDSNLAVHIDTEAPGEIRIIRGSRGRVEVAGRASGGIAGFGLDPSGRRTLTLTAIGADRVAFVVVVPEDVRVHLRLPGHRLGELVGSMRRSASYEWSINEERAPARTLGPGSTAVPGAAMVLDQGPVPRLIQIRNAGAIERLTVRFERGTAFAVTGPVATTVTRRDFSLDIAAATGTDELTLAIPGGTASLIVTIDGQAALEIVDGQPVNRCDPVIDQHVGDGSRWFTYTPSDGIACGRAAPAPAQHRS